MVEENNIGCNLGNIKSDDFQKLLKGLKTKIPESRPKVTYTETADDHALAFDLLSYLLFCQREQLELVPFYNNLFHTANPRTILQATVNNIQLGVERPDTMVALHQIYKMLASKMQLKLPYILQGFLDSEMEDSIDQNGQIFMNKHPKDDSQHMVISIQGKHNHNATSIQFLKFRNWKIKKEPLYVFKNCILVQA